jgi:malate dehydrogenase (oxaloacetate-decarboxylating)
MNSNGNQTIELHKKLRGKIALRPKFPLTSRNDLSLAYTPGVGAVSKAIADHPDRVWELTSRGNWVAVVSDGSAVLGLGNLGPLAALPVMEGKAMLFKEFADVDAFPICLSTQNVEEIIAAVKHIAPSFGGINLEDISAPRCFEIERRLQEELDIPVFHDDQHGTAIVVLAALLNAVKVTGRTFQHLRIVVSGAGAAGASVARILLSQGVQDIVVVDSRGILSRDRTDLNDEKRELVKITNRKNTSGTLKEAMKGQDVFIGVSAPGIVTSDMVKEMASDPIIFAMANPVPEIMPDEARKGGAAIVATGRSDFPNQVNNVLAFPGIFKGALAVRAPKITKEMQLAAAMALAAYVSEPSVNQILPDPLDRSVAQAVARAVIDTAAQRQK